ncbi:LOW QUALITY PROTEIN: uncharacterized protein LOC141833679 [Curcuma longa]|uniref:LOW QUALITY PROTEIN: uncharacterized protein LOC141833679 n=1 Tax=Curcuma longa TaxID=136217 RepID=UPI003D9FAEE0
MATTQTHVLIRQRGVLIRIPILLRRRRRVHVRTLISQQPSRSISGFCSGGSGHEHNPGSLNAVPMAGWWAARSLGLLMIVWLILCFNGKADQAAIRGYGGERRSFPGRRSLPYFPRPPPAVEAAAEGAGLEESKRRVPSCPDPLHNR